MKKGIIHKLLDVTRISSKGQIVIPREIRKEFKIREGDFFATTGISKDLIILKRISPIDKNDLELLKDAKEAWEEIEKGHCKKMSKKEFLKELDQW